MDPRSGRVSGRLHVAAFVLTFLAVVVAWVFFRADSLSSALFVLSKMADPTQIAFGRSEIIQSLLIMIYAGIAWFAPNTQAIMGYDHVNRTVGNGLWRVAATPGFCLCRRGRAGIRDSRNPAAQRIHLFQVLKSPVFRDLLCSGF